jgi:secreted PhoX family phosphatase
MADPPTSAVPPSPATGPVAPYGPLDGIAPDANGIVLPPGFTARVVAVGGERVPGTALDWHPFPDGGACFAAADGGWTYVSNSEVAAAGEGGVSALHFGPDGTVRDAARICRGTTMNCAGGATPWGTWLTCEEHAGGLVWECSITERHGRATPRPALGTFTHEAVAVDPETGAVYLTEDLPDGLLYRFTPTVPGDLAAGVLEAARVGRGGVVTWIAVRDPNAVAGTARASAVGATPFDGGEGICIFGRTLVFTTKGTGQVHRIDLEQMRYAVLREAGPPLDGVDNVTADPLTGDLFVAEDGGNMELVLISADGSVAPFARVAEDPTGSEITGPCLSPDRTRLYFSSQRGPSPKMLKEVIPGCTFDSRNAGITYEVTGPFRKAVAEPEAATTTMAKANPSGAGSSGGSDSGSDEGDSTSAPVVIGGIALVAAAGVGATVALRRRRD